MSFSLVVSRFTYFFSVVALQKTRIVSISGLRRWDLQCMRYEATSILSLKFVKECFVGKTNADVKISLLSFLFSGAELKKMGNSNDSSFIIMSIPHNRSL